MNPANPTLDFVENFRVRRAKHEATALDGVHSDLSRGRKVS
jgi:hypothetical protein